MMTWETLKQIPAGTNLDRLVGVFVMKDNFDTRPYSTQFHMIQTIVNSMGDYSFRLSIVSVKRKTGWVARFSKLAQEFTAIAPTAAHAVALAAVRTMMHEVHERRAIMSEHKAAKKAAKGRPGWSK